jgi:hypothetical protein
MKENEAFRVDLKDINTKKKKLIDSTITRIGKDGKIIERRRIREGEDAGTFMKDVEPIERNLKGEKI